jgi:hypothetical protein
MDANTLTVTLDEQGFRNWYLPVTDHHRRLHGLTIPTTGDHATDSATIRDTIATAWYGDPATRAAKEARFGALPVRAEKSTYLKAWVIQIGGHDVATARAEFVVEYPGLVPAQRERIDANLPA